MNLTDVLFVLCILIFGGHAVYQSFHDLKGLTRDEVCVTVDEESEGA